MKSRHAKEVRHLIAKQFDISVEQLSDQTSFKNALRADSLDLIEIIAQLSKIVVLDNVKTIDLKRLKTVGEFVEYIDKHVST